MTLQTATRESIPLPFNMRSTPIQDVAASSANVHLGREDISGRFSIIDSGPIQIQMETGMVLRVHSGSVQAVQSTNNNERSLAEGDRMVAERSGLLTVRSHARAQLQIDWPVVGSKASTTVGRKN